MLVYVCLLRVYVEDGNGRRLIAVDVALVTAEGDGFRLKPVERSGEVFLEKVELRILDALNSVAVFRVKP